MMKFIRILFLLLLCHGAYAGEKSVKATVVPEKGTVGTVFKYTISVAIRDGGNVSVKLPEKKNIFPDLKSKKKSDKKKEPENFVPLFTIHNAHRDETESEGLKQVQVTVQLSSYRPGKHELPEIKITDSDGVSIGYSIPFITIAELNKEGKEIDVEGPLSLSGNHDRMFILAGVVAVVLLLLFLMFKLFRSWLRKRKIAKALPPVEIFMRDLAGKKVRDLIEHDRVNEYVFTMSAMFRKFLSGEYDCDALEMTTDEIARSMKDILPEEIEKKFGQEMIDIMRLWDFSKFAEFTPTREKLIDNYNRVVDLAGSMSSPMEDQGGEK